MLNTLPPLQLGDLTIPIPIIQGGMGVQVSTASLASAVANCGGGGTIASVGLGENQSGKDFVEASRNGLLREIREARALSSGVIGVNILAALSNFEDLARAAARENVDYIISGAGLPLQLPEYTKGSSVKLIPIVSSARVAHLIIKAWKKRYNKIPDALLVEGPLAGGHLGFAHDDIANAKKNALEEIVTEILAVAHSYEEQWGTPIPVIAAGGIFDGNDIARFFKLGVQGVQMGTRFVATDECSVPQEFKQKYIDASDDDIILIQSPVGLPGRAVRTQFTDSLTDKTSQKFNCSFQCLKTCDVKTAPYCIARKLLNAVDGTLIEDAVVFAGQNVSRIKEVVPVKKLIDTLVEEAITALKD